MTKYPLDAQAIEEISRDLLLHDRSQMELIGSLVNLLEEAMDGDDAEEAEWYKDAETLFRRLNTRKLDFENHRFNQKNGHNVKDKSPYKESEDTLRIGKNQILKEKDLELLDDHSGEEMTPEELAKLFGEKHYKKKIKKTKKISKMSLKEIEEWEKAQDNSNDIYKVSARIKNLARQKAGANLTPIGDVLCNTYTHVMKDLYDFADTVQDKETKIKLIERLRFNEKMPAEFIDATKNGAIR